VWRDTVVVAEQTYYTTKIPTIAHIGSLAFSLASDGDPAITSCTLHYSTPDGDFFTNIATIDDITPTVVTASGEATHFRVDIYFSGSPGDAFALKVRGWK
jgi:hypothetical protein